MACVATTEQQAAKIKKALIDEFGQKAFRNFAARYGPNAARLPSAIAYELADLRQASGRHFL